MARRSRKRATNEQLDACPNHQEAQEQPTVVDAEKPQLLYPETESTLTKEPEIKMAEEKEVKKVEVEERNEPNLFRNEPDSTPAKETITKSVNYLDSKHPELCPKLDPLSPKESNSVLLPESEPVVVKNDANGLSTEPDSRIPRKKKKRKGTSLTTRGGEETNDDQSEHLESIPNSDPLSPKESDPVLLPESQPVAENNGPNKLCAEPESATPRKKRKRKDKSLSMSEGLETNDVHFEHHEFIPDLDPLPLKDSNSVLLPGPESFAEKNNTNQLCTEPESATPRKKKRKGKRKSLSNSEGVEVNHVNSERHELWPNLAEIPPKDTDPLLLPEPAPVGGKNEANQVCTKPDSTSPKFEGAEIKDMDSSSVPPKESNLVLLPEPESFAGKIDSNQPCTEAESVTPRKKKRKGKRKSLSNSEGVEVNQVNSEDCELCPNLAALPPKDPDPLLLPEPAPVTEKNEANQLCTKPDSTSPKFEGAEIKNMDSSSVPPKDSNFVLLPESESFAGKNDSNQLCTEPESVTPRKKKRKGKRKSLSSTEGLEVNPVNSEDCELCPNAATLPPKDPDPLLLPEPAPVREKNEANQLCTKPDSTSPKFEGAEIKDMDSGSVPPKDSNFVLLPESESFAGKNDINQLCTEPESVTPRKKKRKGKRKRLSNSEAVEVNHVDSGHCELCPNLAALSPRDPNPLLLPEPAPVGEKKEANKLCTKPDSTSPKFEGAEIKDIDSENLELCSKLDPVPPRDSDLLLLPESDPAQPKGVDQEKKRKNKKKKNKGKLEGEGVESNRPNDEHSQQCHEAKPTTPEEQNQRKRKRQAMNETHDSSIGSMVTPNYDFGPEGASILNGEAVSRGPWIPKMPLKNYERYERCLECGQICLSDQTCRGLRRLPYKKIQICFFCGTPGHLIGRCPISPGAKCSKGIVMLDDYVRNKCSKGGSC